MLNQCYILDIEHDKNLQKLKTSQSWYAIKLQQITWTISYMVSKQWYWNNNFIANWLHWNSEAQHESNFT